MARKETNTEIPQEHISRVMNSLICEHLMGFERQLNQEGRYEWRGKKSSDDWTEWTTELEEVINFCGDLREAQDLLRYVCRRRGIGYNLIYDPRNDVHNVVVLEVGPGGKPVPKLQITGKALSILICAALCGLHKLDIQAQHKELYPGHYLLLNH